MVLPRLVLNIEANAALPQVGFTKILNEVLIASC